MIPSKGLALDLFAGPGGWSVPLSRVGIRDVGLEWACRTRAAAGLLTVRTDVAAYPVHVFVGLGPRIHRLTSVARRARCGR